MAQTERPAPGATRICLIEDDPIMGESLVDRFELEGWSVDWCQSAAEARAALAATDYGLVISDIRLPDQNGDQLYEQLRREVAALPPFIFVTGFGDLERAVGLLKAGAADYLTKPFEMERLLARVAELLPGHATPSADGATVLGISPAMRQIAQMARRVAPLDAPVLITGETGTGKEVVARHIHALGAGGTFFAVNCAALAEGLVESELFGHEAGAFTGAASVHRGVFERAQGGTLFLDEIGDMPLHTQARLLRVLQDRTLTRVGGERQIEVDIRLMCATHRDLKRHAGDGCFRADLLYRINVVHLHIPPLRERAEDILWLSRGFLDDWSARQGQARRHLAPTAEQEMLGYHWPGNVRELRHRLERACIFSDGPTIWPQALGLSEAAPDSGQQAPAQARLGDYLRACEKRYIEHYLELCEGRINKTAERLGISRKALWEKMKRLGIPQRRG